MLAGLATLSCGWLSRSYYPLSTAPSTSPLRRRRHFASDQYPSHTPTPNGTHGYVDSSGYLPKGKTEVTRLTILRSTVRRLGMHMAPILVTTVTSRRCTNRSPNIRAKSYPSAATREGCGDRLPPARMLAVIMPVRHRRVATRSQYHCQYFAASSQP